MTSSMRALGIAGGLAVAALALATPARAVTGAETSRTLPTQITITANPVQTASATYSFTIVFSGYAVVDGVPQLTVSTTITRTGDGGQIQFQQIVLKVAQDASSFRLRADGEEFVIEAGYRDPFDRTAQPRQVTTTFGQMFSGGKVGLVARLAN